MALIEIKSWINGKVLHTIEADNIRAAVEVLVRQGAYLQGADLQGAYLQGADLQGADLREADLRGADLQGVTYGEGIFMTKPPIMISGLIWTVMILDNHLKIGCELHTFNKWKNFTDREIAIMDPLALAWWKIHKNPIMAMVKALGVKKCH